MVIDSNVEDNPSSSSSDSESEDEYAGDNSAGGGTLTLVDDDCPLLAPPPPELGEGEGEGFEEEGEGEGGDSGTERQTESVNAGKKKEEEKTKKKKRKRKKVLYICTVSCKYDSVRRVAKRCNFKEVPEDEEWNVYWTDYSVALERVMEMKRYQKINHFPGMSEICRKDLLARNMNRMAKLFPKEYNVFPRSWCLPADYGDFQAFTRAKKNKSYIMKPESGCQGKGIWVTKNPREIKATEHQICQQYIAKPFLIDGFKFDLRIYALVTSCDPLRIYVFKDGLARFATCKYHEPTSNNTDNQFMHLTNYAINKHSSDFVRNDDEGGSKRRITTINKWWKENDYDVDKIWSDIDDCIIKTLISAHPILKHNYRTCFPNHVKGSACFEILGFDILLDKKLKPYLLEVNHSPSFHTDAPLDKEIKEALLHDTLMLINCGAVDKRKCIEEDKKKIKDRLFQRQNKKETREELEQAQSQYLEELEQYEQSHLGNFRRIYPLQGTTEKYDKYFSNSGSLFQETAAFKARQEAARVQREEILRKKEKMESMLKKKKEPRPESPGLARRRRAFKRPPVVTRRLTHRTNEFSIDGVLDTSKPMDIIEEEELERISALLQRDNLVRGLGIVEHVYRLLHCTPGTMGIGKEPGKYHEDVQYRPTQYGEAHVMSAAGFPFNQYGIVGGQYAMSRGSTSGQSQSSYWQRANKNVPDSRYRIPFQSHSRYKVKSNTLNRSSVIAADMEQYKQYSQFMATDTRGQDWRSDASTPSANQKRTFSGLKTQKPELVSRSTVPQVRSQINVLDAPSSHNPLTHRRSNIVNPPGLSVVSAPAPVVARPEVSLMDDTGFNSNNRTLGPLSSTTTPLDPVTGLRTTKSQRIRGTVNNLRLQQLELRESQQVVLS